MGNRRKTYSQKLTEYRGQFGESSIPHTITNRYKLFLGGFMEGEASVTVNIRKTDEGFGARIDPEFNVTQHVQGIKHLLACMVIFHTGSIKFKSESNNTYVYFIQNRTRIKEKVIPFYKKYVIPYSCERKVESFENWEKLIELLIEGAHKDKERFRNELAPLVYNVNRQVGCERTFPTLESFYDYFDNFSKKT